MIERNCSGVDSRESVLTVNSRAADLLRQLDGRRVNMPAGELALATAGHAVHSIEPAWRFCWLAIVSDPNVALMLLVVGIYGILFEFWNPGMIVPGVVGAISLLLGLFALSLLPVTVAGIALLILGLALMAAEALTPGFGILGIGGAAAFVFGALFLIDPSETSFPIGVAWPVAVGTAAMAALLSVGVMGAVARSRRQAVRTGAEEMIGARGRVIDWSAGAGHVLVHGERWAARGAADFTAGVAVRVRARRGLVLEIEIDKEASP